MTQKIFEGDLNMKKLAGFGLVFCLFIALSSCDRLSQVNYDKAGRDIMALTNSDASLTLTDYQNIIRQTDMSSKDYLSLVSSDTVSQLVWVLSLDTPEATELKIYGIDVSNLKRAYNIKN